MLATNSGNIKLYAVDDEEEALGDSLISTPFCCIIATSLSNSVFNVSIGNVPDVGKSVDLAILKFLNIVYLSFTVAPPPKVILPPPLAPAPVTEYCAALDGLEAKVNVVSVPPEVFITTKSASAKNSNGTLNAV